MAFPRAGADRTRLSGSEIRRLLQLREKIKVESLRLPRAVQQQLLEVLEQARHWRGTPAAVPEMSRGELIRAIRWRVGTIPLAGAMAAAEFVIHHRPKGPRTRPMETPSRTGPHPRRG